MPHAILLEIGARRDAAHADDDFLALLEYDGCRVSLSAGTRWPNPLPATACMARWAAM